MPRQLTGSRNYLKYWALLGAVFCRSKYKRSDNEDEYGSIFYPTIEGIIEALEKNLTEREKFVLIRRFGLEGSDPMTFKAIGRLLEPEIDEDPNKVVDGHIDAERVRQIEAKAIRKLKHTAHIIFGYPRGSIVK